MTILCKGRLLDLSMPVVMGILNLTPDSFFDGGKYSHADAIFQQAEKMLQEGATILDLGGASSRSGAAEVPEAEEMRRVLPAVTGILQRFPESILSIDTWRAPVAEAAINAGAHIINDISGGSLDPELFATAGRLQTPYILMHMQGTPQTMQQHPHYEDVVTEVLDYFIEKTARLRAVGVKDIILDPGFGFGKTVAHNYTLLRQLHTFGTVTGLPVLAGISRKSMICKALGVKPENALNGTTALHMVALQQGACILRAHDVREAREVITLWQLLQD
ncbi:MAG: dihydropteroate synthase [Chitinophagales bacterium]|nr:dihydropteroate synthase [Chitinophagales bacterium]